MCIFPRNPYLFQIDFHWNFPKNLGEIIIITNKAKKTDYTDTPVELELE